MLRLPRNPLHFRASTTSAPPSNAVEEDDADDDDDAPGLSLPPAQMMLTVMSPSSNRGTVVSASKLPGSQPSKAKLFFDALVNMPSEDGAKNPSVPRIIYIRDFPTLASTSGTWYRPLLNAVRQRRRGPIASPSSPVTNPTTIVFGICPSITPPDVISSSGPQSQLMSLLMNRAGNAPITSAPRPGRTDWNEEEGAVKAREDRLRRRLKKWERNDPSLLDELPPLINQEDGEEANAARNDVLMLGKNFPLRLLPPGLAPNRPLESDSKTTFFRTSVLVPSVRSTADERICRIARRQEINELTTRMAIGSVGGALDATSASSLVPSESNLDSADKKESDADSVESQESKARQTSEHEQMWVEWGKRVELWTTVKHVADRAVGGIVASRVAGAQKQSLDPTPIPWDAVSRAWATQRSLSDLRKSWLKEAVRAVPADATREVEEEDIPPVDEVVERLRRSSDLDSHEQRLLPCIIDPGGCSFIWFSSSANHASDSDNAHIVWTSSSTDSNNRFGPNDCFSTSTTSPGFPTRHSKGA